MVSKLLAKFPKIKIGFLSDEKPSPITTYYLILVPTIVLIVIGFVMVFSASTVMIISEGRDPYRVYLTRFLMMGIGVVGMIILMHISQRFFRKLSPAVFVATLIIQFLVITPLGVEAGGNTNWIKIGPLPQIQPSEFLKVGLALFIGWVLTIETIDRRNPYHIFINVALPSAVAVGGVLLGHDLGTALVFGALVIGALAAAGIPGRWYAYLGIGGALVSGYLLFSKQSRIDRVLAVLPGFREPPSTLNPDQQGHSLWALGSGGLSGVGAGASKEKWNYLQEAHTDFIFAILGEEFGLIGTVFVVICFGVMLYGMFRIILWHRSDYARIVTGGIAMWIASQALINMASVTGLGPVIGVPLPLISTGGSAFVSTCGALGIVLSFARGDTGMEKAFGIRNLLRVRQPK